MPNRHIGPVAALVISLAACGVRKQDQGASASETGSSTTDPTSGDGTGTGTGTGDTDTGDGDDTGETGQMFIPGSDMGIVESCDIWNPNDCVVGAKCTAIGQGEESWANDICVDLMGDAAPGDDCVLTDGDPLSGRDDCGEHSLCWGADPDTHVGYCVRYCEGQPIDPLCPEGLDCGIFNQGVLPVCTAGCDPLDAGADCPQAGDTCVPFTAHWLFYCVPDASRKQGTYATPCTYANECAPGLYCAQAIAVPDCGGDAGCCTPFCDVSDGADACPGKDQGQVCYSWWEEAQDVPGLEHVGACVVPGDETPQPFGSSLRPP